MTIEANTCKARDTYRSAVPRCETISILGRQIGLTKDVGAGTPDVLFLGWDSAAVRRAVFNHIGKKDDDSEPDEDSQSDGYVPRVPSPAGKHGIDCDIIMSLANFPSVGRLPKTT
jgi:hypothetical protein